MDMLEKEDYDQHMLRHFFTLLAIVSIAVVSTMSPAHAVEMSAGLKHEIQLAQPLHVMGAHDGTCEEQEVSRAADSCKCAFACASIIVLTAPPSISAAREGPSSARAFPPTSIHFSNAPPLNERPPKSRLH